MTPTIFTTDQLRAALEVLSPQLYDELATTLANQNPEVNSPVAYQLRVGLQSLSEKVCDEITSTVANTSVAPFPLTTDQLRTGLQTLPQEMYDEISGLVFDYDGGSRDINEAYKPPMQLQISRQIRQEFSQAYYGSPEPWWHSSELHSHCSTGQHHLGYRLPVLRKWLLSLSQETRRILAWSQRKTISCLCSSGSSECTCNLLCKCWEKNLRGAMVLESYRHDWTIQRNVATFYPASGRFFV